MSDEYLFRAYAEEGDLKAFEEIMGRYKVPVYGYILRMIRNAAAADDIFQNVFVKVVKNARKYSDENKFSHWLFTIARNETMDWFRKTKREEISLDVDGEDLKPRADRLSSPEPSPEKAALNSENMALVERALEKLSPEQREVLYMRHYFGMSFREISEVLKIPLGTALARMSRALDRLRREL